MNISYYLCPGPHPVPEDPKQYVVTIGVVVIAETELAAANRVADLCRRLTEDHEILDWSFQSLEPVDSHKGGSR